MSRAAYFRPHQKPAIIIMAVGLHDSGQHPQKPLLSRGGAVTSASTAVRIGGRL